jgi:hypothetical protein
VLCVLANKFCAQLRRVLGVAEAQPDDPFIKDTQSAVKTVLETKTDSGILMQHRQTSRELKVCTACAL